MHYRIDKWTNERHGCLPIASTDSRCQDAAVDGIRGQLSYQSLRAIYPQVFFLKKVLQTYCLNPVLSPRRMSVNEVVMYVSATDAETVCRAAGICTHATGQHVQQRRALNDGTCTLVFSKIPGTARSILLRVTSGEGGFLSIRITIPQVNAG